MILSDPSLVNGTIDAGHTIVYLNNLTTLIIRYLGTSFYIFGLIGELLNMYVFSRSSLRSNPCCLFLLALSIVDLLHIHNSLLVRIVQHGFHRDPIVFFPLACRVRYYIAYVAITLYMIFITLVSYERYASTCKRSSHWHRFSDAASVRYTIFSCTLICCFACLFAFSCYGVDDISSCAVQKGVCTTFTMVYTLVVIGFMPPVFIIIFAWLTLRKLHSIHRRSRAAPVSYKTYLRIKHANEQLTSMVLMQIASMLVSGVPYASLMVYQLSTRYIDKMPLRIAWEHLTTHFIHLLTYVKYVCSAYIYLATSPMYRQCLMFTTAQLRGRFSLGAEIFTSTLWSLSRAEKTTANPSIPLSSFEPTEQRQHRPRVVWFHVMASEQEPSDVVRAMINSLQDDIV